MCHAWTTLRAQMNRLMCAPSVSHAYSATPFDLDVRDDQVVNAHAHGVETDLAHLEPYPEGGGAVDQLLEAHDALLLQHPVEQPRSEAHQIEAGKRQVMDAAAVQ